MSSTLSGKIHKLGNLEAWADRGSIVVRDNRRHIEKRVSVPDWRERMAEIAGYGLSKRGSASGYDRDIYTETVHTVTAMQSILQDAVAQGDVSDPRVLKGLAEDLAGTRKYTMHPSAFS